MPFTQAQENAIWSRNRQLLVSAAAGSGKTAVLVERIYSLLEKDGYSIDRMLIVTFTSAAAAEMRERLELRLMEEGVQSDALRKQADKIDQAQISTLHSFCQKLVREYFEIVGIDPQASLCDERQRALLFQAAIEQTMTHTYQQALQEERLAALVEKFTLTEVEEMLRQLHSFLMAQPCPFNWLEKFCSQKIQLEDLNQGPLADTLLSDCHILLDGAMALWEDISQLESISACREGYAKLIQADGQMIQTIEKAAKQGIPLLVEQMKTVAFDRMPSYRLSDPEEIAIREEIKEVREQYKKLLGDVKKILPQDVQQCLMDMETMNTARQGLAETVQHLHHTFQQMKNEKALLDFNDLEHMAFEILSRPEIRRCVAGRFDAIFVDEYQDISGIQEALLEALKREEEESKEGKPFTCFYVGDVKQSIYRFRQADPTLFMEKQRSFSEKPDATCRKVTLNHNFRSRESVLGAVNRVFEHVMQKEVTEIDYDHHARLHAGLPSEQDPPTRIHIIEGKGIRAVEKPGLEAKLIAKEIQQRVGKPLLDRNGKEMDVLRYRDIVILLPAAKGIAPVVERQLTSLGIPVYSEDGASGLESMEIAQVLAHLKLLSNWMDDLALLAALRGPLYRLSEDELAQIRLEKPEKNASFLEALITTANKERIDPLAKRCMGILQDIRHERFLLQSMPLDEYLWGFLSRSGMYAFYGAQPGGKLRQANLRMLCNHAGEHVKMRGGDVREFLTSVASTKGIRDGKSPTILSPWEDVVRIMTIHKSKGLEFPVVFVMGLGGNLHRKQSAGILSIHSKLGLSLRYVNEKMRTKRQTLLANVIALRTMAEEKAERARVLYVALTRAKDQLIMVGTSSGENMKEDKFMNNNQKYGKAYAVWEAKSMLEWITQVVRQGDSVHNTETEWFSTSLVWGKEEQEILSTVSTCFPQKKGDWEVFFHIPPDKSSILENQEKENELEKLSKQEEKEKRIQSLLEGLPAIHKDGNTQKMGTEGKAGKDTELFEDPLALPWRPHHAPLKIGVTAYCRAMQKAEKQAALESLQEEGEETTSKRLPLSFSKTRLLAEQPQLPAYLRQEQEKTGLLRGIATHKAMSLLPYTSLQVLFKEGKTSPQEIEKVILNEIEILVRTGKMTQEERSLVKTRPLSRFFESDVGKDALLAQEVHREWGFNLQLPNEETLLQGVIDLCYVKQGGWILVDYKTDRVADVRELWDLYGLQIQLYRQALEVGTRLPVKKCILFSLSLGEWAGE